MSTATIRELRTSFPKIRARIEREGEVIITDRGKAAFVLRAFTEKPKKTKPPIDYYARLLSYSGGRMATQAEMDALDEANRGDR
jgi:antitoxin (DNA-binding transcriptional repressor) of toxin-antitoxin stability system